MAYLLDNTGRSVPILNGGSGKDQHPTQALNWGDITCPSPSEGRTFETHAPTTDTGLSRESRRPRDANIVHTRLIYP